MKKGSKLTILIVDDQELNRAILAELFFENYNVIEASNGEEALEILKVQKDKISMVLLDIVMPIMDGFEVLRRMNENKLIERVPVIMITAENSENVVIKGYELGVSDFISKPFNPDIVQHRVKIIRELHNHRRHLEKLLKQEMELVVQQTKKLERTNTFIIDAMSTIVEFRHCESGSHVRRLRSIVKIILSEMSKLNPDLHITNEQITLISEASAMHDLGKIGIPDNILMKPGRLTNEEFDTMKQHTIIGCNILDTLHYDKDDEFFACCYDICRHHHERYDGRGYPDGLKGDEISLASQVVAFADVYDALTNDRVYKPAFSHEQAVGMILRGECGTFNPTLLKSFEIISKNLPEKIEKTIKNSSKASRIPSNKIITAKKNDGVSKRTIHLIEIERRKQQVISNLVGEIILDYQVRKDILTLSEKAKEELGVDIVINDYVANLRQSSNVYHDDLAKISEVISNISRKNPTGSLEIRYMNKDNELQWFEIKYCAIWDSEGLSNILGRMVNIDEQKRRYENLKEMADIDVLTGLYNRRAFIDMIQPKLEDFRHKGYLLLIDLDNFKKVNDTYGHLVGDDVLSQIAIDLKTKIRSNDILARLGGDEFAIYFEDIERIELNQILQKLCYTTCEVVGKTEIITKSIGVASYPTDSDKYEQLLNKADIAMYHSKNRNKARYMFYEEIDN